MKRVAAAFATTVALAGTVACAHIADLSAAGGATPVPSGSGMPSASPAGPTPTPGPCTTAAASGATVLIAMSSSIAAAANANYGSISGYGDATSGNPPAIAAPITAKTKDVIQFVNVDAFATTAIQHSAVGLSGTAFPPIPYAFPAADVSLQGSAIANAGWSTGRIAPADSQGSPCYSAPFTIASPGTYFFGDFDFYNLNLMRSVLVVSGS